MISLTNPGHRLATAFAVHRGLDACGAILGPLSALLLLRLVPDAFDLVIMASLSTALAGLGVIVLLVDKPPLNAVQTRDELPSLRSSLRLLGDKEFRAIVIGAAGLGFATVSDGFVYLLLRENVHADARNIPLYALLTAAFYLLFSVPVGRLADAHGRWRVFIGGYAALASTYGILLQSDGAARLQFLAIGLLGLYYAATDGVLAAMASSVLGAGMRTSGLALLNTANSFSRLVSSVFFGWLWTSYTSRTAVCIFLLVLLAAMFMSATILADRKRTQPN